jgi:hypothetical protein
VLVADGPAANYRTGLMRVLRLEGWSWCTCGSQGRCRIRSRLGGVLVSAGDLARDRETCGQFGVPRTVHASTVAWMERGGLDGAGYCKVCRGFLVEDFPALSPRVFANMACGIKLE